MLGLGIRRGLWAVALGLSVSAGWTHPLLAQGEDPPAWVQTLELPAGWEAAGLEQFVADYGYLRAYANANRLWPKFSGMEQAHLDAITERAWVFLEDEEVLASGDWATVQKLVGYFAHTSKFYDDDRSSVLNTRYAARLAQEGDAVSGSLEDLQLAIIAMRRTGVDDLDARVGQMVNDWVLSNDLSRVGLGDCMKLLWHNRSLLNPSLLSARLSGSITVPEAGVYTFDRYLQPVSEYDWMRVTVGGVVVLDTRPDDNFNASVSGPIDLVAGAQPITVEYARDVSGWGTPGKPELVLMWTPPGEGVVTQVVPASVFQTAAETPGLDAVFYANAAFEGEPVSTGVLSAPQYNHGALLAERWPQMTAALKAQILDPARVGDWADAVHPDGRLNWGLGWTLGFYSIEERGQILRTLTSEHRALLAQHLPENFTVVLGMAAPVPGDVAADLVAAWAEGRDAFMTRPGGWGDPTDPQSYLRLNDGHLRRGWMLQGLADQRWDQVELIRDTALTRADGECNLEVLKLLLLCYEFSSDHHQAELSGVVQESINRIDPDAPGAGDTLASWYVAAAVCEESRRSAQHPTVLRGYASLEKALIHAGSTDTRFWVLNELVTRLISVGDDAAALSIINSLEAQFPPEGVVAGTEENNGGAVTYAGQFQAWRDMAPAYRDAVQAQSERAEVLQWIALHRNEVAGLEEDLLYLHELPAAVRARQRAIIEAHLREVRALLSTREAELAELDRP